MSSTEVGFSLGLRGRYSGRPADRDQWLVVSGDLHVRPQAALPLRRLSAEEPDTQLRTYIRRLICQGCGGRVNSARPVDNPGRTGSHHGGGPQANMVDIKFR